MRKIFAMCMMLVVMLLMISPLPAFAEQSSGIDEGIASIVQLESMERVIVSGLMGGVPLMAKADCKSVEALSAITLTHFYMISTFLTSDGHTGWGFYASHVGKMLDHRELSASFGAGTIVMLKTDIAGTGLARKLGGYGVTASAVFGQSRVPGLLMMI